MTISKESFLTFRDREKARYRSLKPKLFSPQAQGKGTYRRQPRDFCLANDRACENLYTSIRKAAIEYFRERRIPWHDGLDNRRLPSNHLCCSQSCCINFLFPMTSDPELLRTVASRFYPDFEKALPVYTDKPLQGSRFPYVAFEWIGSPPSYPDYLTEQHHKRGRPTRGANYTSADFVFRFLRRDGKIQLVLGEWKYTEDAGSTDYGTPKSPADRKPEVRKRTYREAFHRPGGVFKNQDKSLYDALFVGPFYQLMRLQLLAQEMEPVRELQADVVTVLHVTPEANREFREFVPSPSLKNTHLKDKFPNKGVLDIWEELVPAEKFMSLSTESLLGVLVREAQSTHPAWVAYLEQRYGWGRLGSLS